MSGNPENQKYFDKITTFLNEIGIPWRYGEIQRDSFLTGVQICLGTIVIDKKKLKYPGDVLHEAGHLAIEPEVARGELDGNMRECGQGDTEEMAAIAWSWAALTAISIPPEVVFHPDGYQGRSQSIIQCFQNQRIWGQLHLEGWGLCRVFGGSDCFPHMVKWLRA